MEKCQHDKVYENKILLSFPPQMNWICRKCRVRGRDTIGTTDDNDYDKLVNTFPRVIK